MSEVPKAGETPPIIGSVMIAYAETKEEVLQDLKGDIYSQNEVWNWEKVCTVQICGFILPCYLCSPRGLQADDIVTGADISVQERY